MDLRTPRGLIPDPFRKRGVDLFGDPRHLGRSLFCMWIVAKMNIKMRRLHGQHSGNRRLAGCGQE